MSTEIRVGEPIGFPGELANFDLKKLKTEVRFHPTGMHNSLILVTGVSSVGKDHLLNRVTADFPVPSISVGTILSEMVDVDRDRIREMEYMDYFLVKKKAGELIVDKGPAFVNSHLVTKHRDSLVIDGIFERIINPAYFVAIIGDSREIILRRLERNEKGRRTDIEDEETVAYHQWLTLKATEEMARALGSGFVVVVNNFDNSKQSFNMMRSLGRKVAVNIPG